MHWIERGETEKRPDDTPDEIWQLIERCWNKAPAQRPSAKNVVAVLSSNNSNLAKSISNYSIFSIKGNLDSVGPNNMQTETLNTFSATTQPAFSIKNNLTSDNTMFNH